MCAIIDANVAGLFFLNPNHQDFSALRKWIFSGAGAMVTGGENLSELRKVTAAIPFLAELQRGGRLHVASPKEVAAEQKIVQKLGLCASDDAHVLALARVSGARLVCTHDGALQADFKTKLLIDAPRGKVFAHQAHAKTLLRHSSGCPGRRPTK